MPNQVWNMMSFDSTFYIYSCDLAVLVASSFASTLFDLPSKCLINHCKSFCASTDCLSSVALFYNHVFDPGIIVVSFDDGFRYCMLLPHFPLLLLVSFRSYFMQLAPLNLPINQQNTLSCASGKFHLYPLNTYHVSTKSCLRVMAGIFFVPLILHYTSK